MDIQEIARRARLPLRTVRSVCDHRLVPGLRARRQPGRAGRPFEFREAEAFAVGVGAALVHGGVRRATVRALLTGLANTRWPLPGMAPGDWTARTALQALFVEGEGPAYLWLTRQGMVRLHFGPRVDTAWFPPGRPREWLDPALYHPAVFTCLRLRRLRAAFRPTGGRA